MGFEFNEVILKFLKMYIINYFTYATSIKIIHLNNSKNNNRTNNYFYNIKHKLFC